MQPFESWTTAWKLSKYGVFLVHIFPHLDWIWRFNPYSSAFISNAGKCRPEKLRIWTIFTQWALYGFLCFPRGTKLWEGVLSNKLRMKQKIKMERLTHSFQMHPFSNPWKQGVEKGYIGNEWVKTSICVCCKHPPGLPEKQCQVES